MSLDLFQSCLDPSRGLQRDLDPWGTKEKEALLLWFQGVVLGLSSRSSKRSITIIGTAATSDSSNET